MNKNKTVFIEYSSAGKGQHFITVIQYDDGRRKIIGRIFREYDRESKKINYTARNWSGNAIFTDINNLTELKTKFKEHGKQLAQLIPDIPLRYNQSARVSHFQRLEGENDARAIQGRGIRNVQERELSGENVQQPDPPKARGTEPEPKPDTPADQNENVDTPEKSDRAQEIEHIRDQNQENEHERDRDM